MLVKESSSCVIDLPDDDPECIERVLAFLYTQDYSEAGHTMNLKAEAASDTRGSSKRKPTSPTEAPRKRRPAPFDTDGLTDTPGTVADESSSNLFANLPAINLSKSAKLESSPLEKVSVEDGVIFNNIDVYIAADKFGIDKLYALAASRICEWLSANFTPEGFLDAAQKVMSSTPNDPTLTDHLDQLITEHLSFFKKNEEFFSFLDEFGRLGSRIIARMLEINRELVACLSLWNSAKVSLEQGRYCIKCRNWLNGIIDIDDDQIVVKCRSCKAIN
ncbi:hypothetical protein N7509_012083 [Penicillium cosmopolitanum]|uniref:BTB domain-containing protein n=1 Tax=Penicillium cosmopolitanum TaxID=1131564 RepID=A0A9W9SKK2_9EURO|nr:uncharacterized protein N7509_012083 [Penicillium cosmopolitanum]KAJ5378964.1 hypothetical protein N7509_012083 [Penicillium cosmopolitanum]